jgi:hypothetical protein
MHVWLEIPEAINPNFYVVVGICGDFAMNMGTHRATKLLGLAH